MKGFIVGIDEVGRGAVAGPLVVGASLGYWDKENKTFLKGIRDSKKLTPKQREDWFLKFKKGEIKFYTSEISNKLIDKNGMGWALKKAVANVLKKILRRSSIMKSESRPQRASGKKIPDMVYLDGGLHAPEKYKQKTIIRGDDKIPMISAASVYAKVYRDRLMIRMDRKYPYDFKIHKGYGTKAHFDKIRGKGISTIHRKTFLKNMSK
jgi:ribonuclease HII